MLLEKWVRSQEDVQTPLAQVILQLSQPQAAVGTTASALGSGLCECPPIPLSHFPCPPTMSQSLRHFEVSSPGFAKPNRQQEAHGC